MLELDALDIDRGIIFPKDFEISTADLGGMALKAVRFDVDAKLIGDELIFAELCIDVGIGDVQSIKVHFAWQPAAFFCL